MRRDPTWRIPFGILALLAALFVYGIGVTHFAARLLTGRPLALQALAYLVLGLIWLLPLRRFLIWMETGRWR